MEERLKLADIGHWSSIKWGTRRGEGCIYLRVYVYQGLSIEQHDAIVTAMYGLTEEGGLPIIEMEEPKLSFNRNGMNWMVRAKIDETLLPEPTHDPRDEATVLLKFKVAMQEKGWTEGQPI
jgi:hypothetical protein